MRVADGPIVASVEKDLPFKAEKSPGGHGWR